MSDDNNPTTRVEYLEYAAELSAPNEYKPGCRLPTVKPGERCVHFRDKVKLIPRSDWDRWAKQVDLRPLVKSILDQNGYGSCAAESVTQAIMVARELSGQPHVKLNPWAMYRTTSGGRDQGSNIEDNVRYAMEYGVPSQAVHSRSKGVFGRDGAISEEAKYDALNYRILEYFDITNVAEFVTGRGQIETSYKLGFKHLWDSLYPGSWDRNDWVWCVEFEVKK